MPSDRSAAQANHLRRVFFFRASHLVDFGFVLGNHHDMAELPVVSTVTGFLAERIFKMGSSRNPCGVLLMLACVMFVPMSLASAQSWSNSIKLADGEKKTILFNGKDLSGWEGDQKYWSVRNGLIRTANEKGDTVKSGTYLFTKKHYRNFRLLLEVKQTVDDDHHFMHSAVAALGKKVTDGDNQFGHEGPLFMFCQDWGIWDTSGRGRVFPPNQKGPIRSSSYEKKGDWNQIEILVVGNHVRMVANGQLVVDYVEAPSVLKTGPIGLQLHGNRQPQEFHFRGLVLVDSPVDELATLSTSK